MRWSLVLTTLIATFSMQSLLSFALVTTQNEVTLEKRVLPSFGKGKGKGKGKAQNVKASSSTYRSNSMEHPYAYDFSDPSAVHVQSVPKDQRQSFFKKLFKGKKYDADHVYETQMYHNTLQQQGTSHSQLPSHLQGEARRIMNGPDNMAPIPPSVNRSKGQLVKWGMKGKSIGKSSGLARSYSLNSYPTARQTAEELQQTFQQHGYGHSGPTFHDTLHNTMTHAGVLTPGQPSPPGSPHRSQSVSYHHSGSQVVIPGQSSQSSRRKSSRQQRTSSVSSPPQPVIQHVPPHPAYQHHSGSQAVIPVQSSQSSRRKSSRQQRASSVSSPQPIFHHAPPVQPVVHHAPPVQPVYQHPHHNPGSQAVIPVQSSQSTRRKSSRRQRASSVSSPPALHRTVQPMVQYAYPHQPVYPHSHQPAYPHALPVQPYPSHGPYAASSSYVPHQPQHVVPYHPHASSSHNTYPYASNPQNPYPYTSNSYYPPTP